MSFAERKLGEVLQAFAAPTPTPGGGSASALAAALGLALLTMVAGMGRTREGTEDDRGILDGVVEALVALREHVVQLIDDDAAAYDAVVAAYRMPKGTHSDKTARRAIVQAALRGAAEVPLDVMRACQAGLTAAIDVARHGNPAAASDVGVALELLGAGVEGAALNVRANLVAIDEAGWVEGVESEVARLQAAAHLLTAEARAALS